MPTTDRRKQVSQALNQFYHQPIARVSFELLVTLAAILFFAVFAIRPTLLTMSDLIKEIEDKERLEQALNLKIAALSTAQGEYLQLESRLPVLDEAIPTNPEVIDTLKILEKIASDRGLVISALNVGNLPAEADPNTPFSEMSQQSMPISLTVAGDYPTIRQFVEDLRAARRSFVVDSVTFTTGDEQGSEVLKATMTVNAPYFGVDAGNSSPRPANTTQDDLE